MLSLARTKQGGQVICNQMDSRFQSLSSEMSTRHDRVHSELRSLDGAIGELKRRIDTITRRES